MKTIGSYDAGAGMITTKADPTPADPNPCTIGRPNSDRAGTVALLASLAAADGCVQFSRVAFNDAAAQPPGLTYIPFALDVLTYAFRADSTTIPTDLSIVALRDIYLCHPALIYPSNPDGFRPLLGVFGSANRRYFLNSLGITDSPTLTAQHPCLTDVAPDNDGRFLTHPNQIIPYSGSSWLAQANRVVPDKRGRTILGSINGISTMVVNTGVPPGRSAFVRELYNVVPTAALIPGAPITAVFDGPVSDPNPRVTR